LLSPHVHMDIGGRNALFPWRVVLRRGGSFLERRRRCSRRRGNWAHCRHIRARRRRRLISMRAGTGAGGMQRSKWSSEEEKISYKLAGMLDLWLQLNQE
jgi:hypothetical protein